MLDSHRRRRPLRVLAYALLAVGALVLMVDPTQSLQGQSIAIRWVWSGLLLAGSLSAVYGAARDRYMVEFVGLPLLMASFVGLTIVLAARHTTGTIAFGCFLGAIVVIMWSRWLDLWRLVTTTVRAERRRR